MYLFLLFFTFVFFYEQGFLLGFLKLGYHPKDQDEIRKHICKKKFLSKTSYSQIFVNKQWWGVGSI